MQVQTTAMKCEAEDQCFTRNENTTAAATTTQTCHVIALAVMCWLLTTKATKLSHRKTELDWAVCDQYNSVGT